MRPLGCSHTYKCLLCFSTYINKGVQLIEASLKGQKSEDDEFRMCWTTPGHLAGMAEDLGFPNDCQQRVRFLWSTFFRMHG